MMESCLSTMVQFVVADVTRWSYHESQTFLGYMMDITMYVCMCSQTGSNALVLLCLKKKIDKLVYNSNPSYKKIHLL